MSLVNGTAVDQWREALGPERVTTDEHELALLLENTTGFVGRALVAALRPDSTEHVARIVRIAREHSVTLHPFSTGMNWGLGSKVPPRGGGALIDLRSLNRIREVNASRHYAIIEPGVTQRQLSDHLREHGYRLVLNVTGSSPSSSVLGNVLERGTGFRNQRTEDLRGVEVVLGTGAVLHTGFWREEATPRQTHHYKYGIGPYLDGLFTQSNLGVVTAIVVNLLPVQEQTRMLMFRFPDPLLARVVDALSQLFTEGTLRSIVHIFNDKRILTMSARKEVATWTGMAAVDGPSELVPAVMDRIRRTLEDGGASAVFFSVEDVAGADVDPMIQGMYRLHVGDPNGVFMQGLYNTLGGGQAEVADPDDLDRSRFGMLACLPLLPMDGALVVDAVGLVEEVCQRHGLAPAVALNPIDADGMESVVNVYFDRTSTADVASAHACSRELHDILFEDGFRFYRVDIDNMQQLTAEKSPFWEAARALKTALDPDGIIDPGRYNPD